MTKSDETRELSFEESLRRLEVILEKMNAGDALLEDSLTLFEEADKLISSCYKRLTSVEQKVEMLIKNRNGELSLGEDSRPRTEDFPGR